MIKYKGGYKYQLAATYKVKVNIVQELEIFSKFIRLVGGVLIIKEGYAWDGPSGPTFDTKNFMRGSLVHDALYQLIREGQLSGAHRLQADIELRRICREDGMSKIRAWWVFKAVRVFGKSAATNKRKIITAP